MQDAENPPLHPAMRLFSAGVIIILIVGAGLFLAPDLVKPRWPWAVTPFNARFLGGFYIAEMAGMAALLVWNRWSPARLILVMALVFTVIVTIASLINLETFNFQRKSPWVWFAVYILAALVSATALFLGRDRPQVRNPALASATRRWFQIESLLLGAYGIALLLLPVFASSFWPWPIDTFHAQAYSAVFLAGAAGVILLWRSATREEMLVLGVAQLIFGLLALLGLFLTDAVVHRIVWTSPGTIAWLLIFGLIALSALGKFRIGLATAR